MINGIYVLFLFILLGCGETVTLVKSNNITGSDGDGGSSETSQNHFFKVQFSGSNFITISDGIETQVKQVDFNFYYFRPIGDEVSLPHLPWKTTPIIPTYHDINETVRIFNLHTEQYFDLPGTYEWVALVGEWGDYAFLLMENSDGEYELWKTDGSTLAAAQVMTLTGYEVYETVRSQNALYIFGELGGQQNLLRLDYSSFTRSSVLTNISNFELIESRLFSSDVAIVADDKLIDVTTGDIFTFPVAMDYDDELEATRFSSGWHLIISDIDGDMRFIKFRNSGVETVVLTDDSFIIEDGYCSEKDSYSFDCVSDGSSFTVRGYPYAQSVVNNTYYFCVDDCYAKINGVWTTTIDPMFPTEDFDAWGVFLEPWMSSKLASDVIFAVEEMDEVHGFQISTNNSYRNLGKGSYISLLNQYVEPKDQKPRYLVIAPPPLQ